jgi:hypothetical protein
LLFVLGLSRLFTRLFRLLAGLFLKCALGLANPLKPALPPPEFLRQLLSGSILTLAPIFRLVLSVRLSEQPSDLLSKLPLFFFHPPVTHRLMLGRVGFHLTAIDRYPPSFIAPAFSANRKTCSNSPSTALR